MFKHTNKNYKNFSLHDCRITSIIKESNSLQLIFENGFYILRNTELNEKNHVLLTTESSILIENEVFESFTYYKENAGISISKEDFYSKINSSIYEFEVVHTNINDYSIKLEGYLWFDHEPYSYPCELFLKCEKNNITFSWNSYTEVLE